MKTSNKLALIVVVITLVLLGLGIYAHSNLRGWFTNPTADAKQMILVLADDWTSTTGILQRFERPSKDALWQSVGDKIVVNLGKNGMGWGIGLHGSVLTSDPKVFEGAKKSPAGVFAITLAFGKDSARNLGVKLPYIKITPTVFCPDDVASKFYNSLVDIKTTTVDWKSAEDMYGYMKQGMYAYGFVVNHNYYKPISGRGSCFFVHVYSGPGMPTAGCTAFAPESVKDIIKWIEPTQDPVLVQLPKNIYTLFKNYWSLPTVQ